MTLTHIAFQRLYNQRIEGPKYQTPEQAVAWLGAVQAQEYAWVKWGLGLRLQDAQDAEIEQAFTEGRILRTHMMRPTWHFVTAEDIRWMQALTAPRVHARNALYYRRLELDEPVLNRSLDLLVAALQGGRQRTRQDLAAGLAQAGIEAQGQRLAYLVMYAELEGVLCSGPRRGKQHTYALLEERAPQARVLDRDQALAELARRYFSSHGPALVKDFAWWSGLTQAEIKAGLELAKPHLEPQEINGRTYWRAEPAPEIQRKSPTVYLLPPFDEYTIAYNDYSPILDPSFAQQAREELYGGAVVIDGQGTGYWQRRFQKGAALIELTPFRPYSAAELAAIEAAAHCFGEFLDMPVTVSRTP